ncbi:hypothetical protein O1D97_03470 [Marinomonas sp. 15G1-11]|uniref:Uncharacterized protein n=1 Tax=Marinomonas phaeophyticola TaxID=3004091 RepID=A0ABT4JQR2_9GAMM|nr:hypothetical protein [Marinomonas sp. 15G1-11]MCZ2720728.1 hypothetical protein [Marinomonas sp. 15G1-11]
MKGETPDSVEERKEKSYGWSYAPLIMEEVLADQTINQEFEHFSLSDVTIPNSPHVFYDSDLNGGEQNFVSVIKKKMKFLVVFGRANTQ